MFERNERVDLVLLIVEFVLLTSDLLFHWEEVPLVRAMSLLLILVGKIHFLYLVDV